MCFVCLHAMVMVWVVVLCVSSVYKVRNFLCRLPSLATVVEMMNFTSTSVMQDGCFLSSVVECLD